MSTDTRTAKLVSNDSSTFELATAGLLALSVVGVVLGFAGLFMVVPASSTIAGVGAATLVGGLLAVVGLATLGVGAVSALELVETQPSYTPGMVTGVAYGLLTFVVA